MLIGNIIARRVKDGRTYTCANGSMQHLTEADLSALRAQLVTAIDEAKADLAAFDARTEALAAEPIAEDAKP